MEEGGVSIHEGVPGLRIPPNARIQEFFFLFGYAHALGPVLALRLYQRISDFRLAMQAKAESGVA
jgi:hypothetical protein